MRTRLALAGGLLAASFLVSADSCSSTTPSEQVSAVDQQREQATNEVATEQTYSYEIDNIKARRVLFGKPGMTGYVAFLNAAGQPIAYYTVNGKCTSSGKRITRPDETASPFGGNNTVVRSAIGEDGVYGSSEEYIYCFTTSGRYVQWHGDYLYSDQPFNLQIKPLVLDLTGKTQHQ